MEQHNSHHEHHGKTALGIPENINAVLCYAFGWVSGLIFLVVEKDNKTIRFHAMQSLAVFAGLHLLHVALTITIIGILLLPLLGLVAFVLWLFLMWKAFQGEKYKLPKIGDWAEKQVA